MNKPTIYLCQNHEHDNALTLKQNCNSDYNSGWICRAHGCLDLKQSGARGNHHYLIGEISAQEGNFTGHSEYYDSDGGQTHCMGGVGYFGGVNFGSVEAAISYLKTYFDLVACPKNQAQNENPLADQSWIDSIE